MSTISSVCTSTRPRSRRSADMSSVGWDVAGASVTRLRSRVGVCGSRLSTDYASPVCGCRTGLSERRERREDLLVIGLVTRIVEHLTMVDDTVLVQDEYRALGDPFEPNHVFVEDAVLADDFLVEITEQRELKPLVGMKRLQSEERIDADTEHLSSGAIEARD